MAMFTGFKPQGLQKIASKMGYAGRMEEFDQYLQQNPDKQREMIVYQGRAQEMARGGMVKKMAVGGVPGAAVIPNFINPTTGQQYLNREAAPDPSALVAYTGQNMPVAPQPAPIQTQPAPQPDPRALPQQNIPQLSVPTDSTIGQVSSQQAITPALPTGGTTVPVGTQLTQEQMLAPTSGQLSGTVSVPTAMAQTTMAEQPTATTANIVDAQGVAEQVNTSLDTLQAAQTNETDPRSQILAAQQTASSVGSLTSAQGNAILLENPVQRQVQTGELISGVANAETASTYAEQIQAATATPTNQATVQGQLATLTANFDASNPPAWAAGTLRAVQAQMAQRGLGASSMAGQAMIQGALESALPIAQADSQTVRTFELQNLTNRQQRAMLSAQQRATFIGQEFDQDFQSRVRNAASIADIANRNFTAEQSIALENSKNANTMNLNNLSNNQALVMAEAAALSQMDSANLNARQQSAVQNANNFLQLDMANLTNEQQTSLYNAQAINQSILTDQAAVNAASQFNATSDNQTNQFMANLSNQVSQFNATQTNAQEQFNAGETNTITKFNNEVANQRDQFNAQNQIAIAQNNAVWRREIATADTAAINRANELNAKAVLDISTASYNNLWAFYSDTIEWAWKSAESEQDRINALAVAEVSKEAQEYASNASKSAAGKTALGSMMGMIGAAMI